MFGIFDPPAPSTAPKIVFVHLMKTAGTSLVNWMQRHYRYQDVFHEGAYWRVFFDMPAEVRRTKRFVRGHWDAYICHHYPQSAGYRFMTVLRNPVERTVSNYWHLRGAPDLAERWHFARAPGYSLEDFIEDERAFPLNRNFQTAKLGFDLSAKLDLAAIRRNMDVRYPAGDAELRHALNFIDSCDVLGVTEQLPILLDDLARLYGTPVDLGPARLRQYRPEDAPVPRGIAARIRQRNALDVALYEHACALIARQRRRRYYRVLGLGRRRAAVPPIDAAATGAAAWTADAPFFGTGWSDVQCFGHPMLPPHRWTVPGTDSTLAVRLPPRAAMHLRVHVLRLVIPAQKDGFSLQLDGRPVPWSRVTLDETHGPGGGMYDAVLPPPRRRLASLGLRTAQSASFADADPASGDRTLRGAAIVGLALSASPPGDPPQQGARAGALAAPPAGDRAAGATA